MNPLDDAVVVASYDSSNPFMDYNTFPENRVVLDKAYSDEEGLVILDLSGHGIPVGAQIEIAVNVCQHYQKVIKVFYNPN